jgi:hypothetical protein
MQKVSLNQQTSSSAVFPGFAPQSGQLEHAATNRVNYDQMQSFMLTLSDKPK